MIEPLRLSFDVRCSVDHAFTTWTERMGVWWPKSHSASGDPATRIHLEPRLGGRIYERTSDGSEIDWGEITLWEPPTKLGYLWHIRQDRSRATDVVVRFHAESDDVTRVEIVHDGWDRLGELGPEWRDRNRGGWRGMLPHFIAAASDVDAAMVVIAGLD